MKNINRKRIWEIVEAAQEGDKISRIFDVAILALILVNILLSIFGTVQAFYNKYSKVLEIIEIISVSVFSVEYVLRLWSCTSDKRYQSMVGRARFLISPLAVIDLLAILPFYLPFIGVDLRFLRVLRLFRLLRIAKIGRYYKSLTLIKNVFLAKKEELILTGSLMALLLIISSSLLFYCENHVQPDSYSSIPASFWWATATVTTVGYGDIYPVTSMGKIFASLTSILGIVMFALPTGILGAGFVEEVNKKKKENRCCPHCGQLL